MYQKMPLSVFFALKPGDSYLVKWAKDDDAENGLRLDYERQTVAENRPEGIYPTDSSYEWTRDEAHHDPKLEGNALDTGRGLAYFYYDRR